jgi:hypothetical protein
MNERIPEIQPSDAWRAGQRWGEDTLVGLDAHLTWDTGDSAGPQALESFLSTLFRVEDIGGPHPEPVYYRGGFTLRVLSQRQRGAVLRIESAGQDGLDSAEWGAQLLVEALRPLAGSLALRWTEREPTRIVSTQEAPNRDR